VSRSQFYPIAAVAVLFFMPLQPQASPADLGPSSFRACAPAPQLVQIVSAVVPSHEARQPSSLRDPASRSVSVEGSAGRYQVRSGSAAAVTISAPVDAAACVAAPAEAVHLQTGGTIPGYDVAAVAAVLAYRESNPWPYGAAHIDDPRTWLGVRNRNGRAFVSIFDFKTLHSKGAFDCSGQEYYRVDVQTFAVKPYEGCVEGAPPKRVLPWLKDLPD
jgi:hypothetical protein